MTTLAHNHPIQAVFGGLLLGEELARKTGQLSLAVICESAAEWADSARDVFAAIVRDAGAGELLVDEVAKDGHITPTEARQLRGIFEEIEVEAKEGRVIS